MSSKRSYIREEIIKIKYRDPQDNFSIIEETPSGYVVEIRWTNKEKEVLTIKVG